MERRDREMNKSGSLMQKTVKAVRLGKTTTNA